MRMEGVGGGGMIVVSSKSYYFQNIKINTNLKPYNFISIPIVHFFPSQKKEPVVYYVHVSIYAAVAITCHAAI